MLCYTPNAPFTGFTLPREEGPESDLLLLDTMKVDLKLEKVIIYESILTAENLYK